MTLKARIKQRTPVPALRAYHWARRCRSRIAGRTIPRWVRRAYRAARGRWDPNDPLFGVHAQPGSLARAYQDVSSLPGYFTYDDAVAFTLVLETQSAEGLRGDVLEIGSYHGRSTTFMARGIEPTERLIVCDTFEEPTDWLYPEPPSPAVLQRNVTSRVPALRPEQLVIRAGRSDALDLEGASLRFVHVDGGHSHDVALFDLRLAAAHLLPGGVIVVDDFAHESHPEVTTAVEEFLREAPEFSVLADVNRWTEPGRKLYLYRPKVVDIERRPRSDSTVPVGS